MADTYGASFAPTQENAAQGPLNGQIDGLPAAIRILALRLPRVLGAHAIGSPDLLNAPGARGMDPIASAVIATLAKTLAPHAMGLPGGTAGPDPFFGGQMPGAGPFRPSGDPGIGGMVPSGFKGTRLVTQNDPTASPFMGGRPAGPAGGGFGFRGRIPQ